MEPLVESAKPNSLRTPSDIAVEARTCQTAVRNALAVLRVRCGSNPEVVKLVDLCDRQMVRLAELTREWHPDSWEGRGG